MAGTFRGSIVHFIGGHVDNSSENCSTTGVPQVTAGTHTFALNIKFRSTVGFGPASVWALFVPFDGDGNKP